MLRRTMRRNAAIAVSTKIVAEVLEQKAWPSLRRTLPLFSPGIGRPSDHQSRDEYRKNHETSIP